MRTQSEPAQALRGGPTPQPESPQGLPARGCLGLFLGLLLGSLALLGAGLWTAYVGPLAPVATDSPQAGITITVQEAYMSQVVGQSIPKLPSGLATDVQLDLQPGGRIAFRSRLQYTLLGQNMGGDVSGTVTLAARNGQLAIGFADIKVLGFNLPALGQTLVNELSSRMSQVINDQIRAGLGEDAYIVSLSTDDRQMILQAR